MLPSAPSPRSPRPFAPPPRRGRNSETRSQEIETLQKRVQTLRDPKARTTELESLRERLSSRDREGRDQGRRRPPSGHRQLVGQARKARERVEPVYRDRVEPVVKERVEPVYRERVEPVVKERVEPIYRDRVEPAVKKVRERICRLARAALERWRARRSLLAHTREREAAPLLPRKPGPCGPVFMFPGPGRGRALLQCGDRADQGTDHREADPGHRPGAAAFHRRAGDGALDRHPR